MKQYHSEGIFKVLPPPPPSEMKQYMTRSRQINIDTRDCCTYQSTGQSLVAVSVQLLLLSYWPTFMYLLLVGLEPGIINILNSGEHETPSMRLTPVYDSFIIQLNLKQLSLPSYTFSIGVHSIFNSIVPIKRLYLYNACITKFKMIFMFNLQYTLWS